jgi:hypothetical protein
MAQDNEGYILYPAGYPEHKIRRIHAVGGLRLPKILKNMI